MRLAAAPSEDENDLSIAGLDDRFNILEEDPTTKPSAEMLAASAPVDDPGSSLFTPDFRGKTVRQVIEASSESGMAISMNGQGIARAQWPRPGAPLQDGTKVRIEFRR